MNWAGSLQVLHLVRHVPQLEGWTSALTIPLLYFFRLRVFPEAQARLDAQTAVRGFHLVPPHSGRSFLKPLPPTLPDFEDNIQLASAEMVGAEYLITRNTKDFQPLSSARTDARSLAGVGLGSNAIRRPHTPCDSR